MPIKKSRKTVWIVLAVILLAAFVENGCAQARWASLRIRHAILGFEFDYWFNLKSDRKQPTPQQSVSLSI